MAHLTPFFPGSLIILAMYASQVLVVASARDERGFFDGITGSVSKVMGTLEQQMSPEAMMSFCKHHGYTYWVGQGPEPVAASGLMSTWGSFAGGVWDLAKGVSGGEGGLGGQAIDGTCTGGGWSKQPPQPQYPPIYNPIYYPAPPPPVYEPIYVYPPPPAPAVIEEEPF